MGLDMYLTKKHYVQNWDFTPKEARYEITISKGGVPSSIPTEKICYVETSEIYWRKANAIHNWFVENVQEGVDECQSSYVSREQLLELLRVVTEVLEDHNKAPELLPAVEGFFFGSTDYDEWYWKDLGRTKVELEKVLAVDDDGSFYYQASW